MAPAAATVTGTAEAMNNNNWLSFSLSPMEMLAHTQHQQQLPSHSYFLDSFYSTPSGGDNNQQEAMGMYSNYIINHQPSSTVPKLEDFFADNNASYNNNSQQQQQTESRTEDSSSQLTHHFYDNYYLHQQQQQDLNAVANSTGFAAAFSNNSGSEVDDSASATQLACVEYVGHHSVEHELVTVASNAVSGGSLSLAVVPEVVEKSIGDVAVVGNDTTTTVKKVSDTFGQRTSIYRGVTRHRWTGRYEAHLWDNSCRREGQARKGRQVYLGGYDKEDKAARAYDLAALKYWGPTATTNFPVSTYAKEVEDMQLATKQEFIASLRRKSSGFSRGASIYRGVTRHHQQGRWQARIGRVAGNKDLYLGTFATEEEAAEAYDIAAIKFRGTNAVTNFEMNRYDVDAILNSNLPVGGAAKRLKLATASNDQKPLLTLDQHSHSSNGSDGNSSTINFSAIQPVPQMSFDPATAFYHQNLLHHLNSNGNMSGPVMTLDGYGSSVGGQMSLMPQTPAEFYIWPHQSY